MGICDRRDRAEDPQYTQSVRRPPGPAIKRHSDPSVAGRDAGRGFRRRPAVRTSYAAVAGFCASLEDRPNALDGQRRLDGPDYRPFSDVTISQVEFVEVSFVLIG
jgi:hypothetical protein